MPIVDLENNRVRYQFEVLGKYTIIRGNSGTGKTTLCDIVTAAKNPTGGIKNRSTAPLLTLRDDYEVMDISKLNGYVIFIDEDSAILNSGDYENWLQAVDAYFVIITRKKMDNLPVSVDSIYEIISNGRQHVLKKMDYRFKSQELFDVDVIVCEDSCSGKQFMCEVLKYANNLDIPCSSAAGKTSIVKTLQDKLNEGYRNFVVVYDASAFGTNIDGLKNFMGLYSQYNFYIIDWESFENYILGTEVFNLRYTLKDAGCKYESLEQFSTNKLDELLQQYMGGYSKSHLPKCFKVRGCINCTSNKSCYYVGYAFNKFIYGKVGVLFNRLRGNTSFKYHLKEVHRGKNGNITHVTIRDNFGRYKVVSKGELKNSLKQGCQIENVSLTSDNRLKIEKGANYEQTICTNSNKT